jgi:ABC-2 type transport system ATP-binding protein
MTEERFRGVRIVTNDLHVSYDSQFALESDGLNLTGNVIAILGHNGAGKSTLIKALLGLLTPERGRLEVRATCGDGEAEAVLVPEQDMAFCPETGAVFHDIKVESYVQLWCRIKHNDGSYYRNEGRRIIERLELEPLLKRLGRELSKGQRRRVQTAIGFLTRPRLFLFDEPFDGLDVQRSSELTELIESEIGNMSVLLSSHRMDVIERLADAVIVLKEGHILTSGPLDEVCMTLCGKSLLVHGISAHERAIEQLRSRYPDALINRLGAQISVTGHGPTETDLHRLLAAEFRESFQIESVRPSLTDAMNFHLKSVRAAANPTGPIQP